MTEANAQRLIKKVAKEDFDGDVLALLEHATNASPCPGICTNPNCEELNDECDPDTTDGCCPECEGETVQSVLILAGLI